MSARRRAAEREEYEDSLLAFFARAWQEIDPAPFVLAEHHKVLAGILEDIMYGEVRDFIANIPPRHAKSNLVSVIWPAWIWAQPESRNARLAGPHVSFLCVSYGVDLAETLAIRMRRLILSEWYQGLWGHRFKLLDDQNSRDDFGNDKGGIRLSKSIRGGILGRGADIHIIDDPHKQNEVESEAERRQVVRVLSEGLPTRVTDPRIHARLLVMQRQAPQDATDWALSNWREDLTHLMLPMRFNPDYASPLDWRTEPGELLWPEVWTESAVADLERVLSSEGGDFAVAAQLQQVPIPRGGGGIFKAEWLEPWPPNNPDGSFPEELIQNGRILPPALEYVVACVDTAFTKNDANDRNAMAVFGVFRAEGRGVIVRQHDGSIKRIADDYGYPKVLLLHGWAKRLELHGPPEQIPEGVTAEDWASYRWREYRQKSWGLVEWVYDECRRYKVDHLVILTGGQGHGLEQEMRRLHGDADWGVSLDSERHGDKIARAYAVQHLFSSRQVYVPTFADGTRPSWAPPLLDELMLFPHGRHDDFADAAVGCLRHLREIGLFERRERWEKDELRAISYQVNRRVPLPYDV